MGKKPKTPTDAKTRLAILQAWWARRRTCRRFGFEEALRAFIREQGTRGVRISRHTVYNWDLAYLQRGLKGLEDRRSERAGRERTPFLDAMAKVYFGRPTLAQAFRLVKAEAVAKGWNGESYSACKRYVARLRIERTSTVHNRRA